MVILGTEVDPEHPEEPGPPVALSAEGRRQGTYVLGINGTGKSNLLLDVALQDIEAGDGLCLMDPHGDLIEDILERIPDHRLDDVILFDPADIDFPFGLNLFECDDLANPLHVDRVCSEVVLTLKKAFADSWGPRMEDIIRHSILALMRTPGCSMLDMLPFLTDEAKREKYISLVNDPVVNHYWEKIFPKNAGVRSEWISSTMNKLGRFLTNPVTRNIVSQPKSSFDFRAVMDDSKILLINLSKGLLGEDNSTLIGAILVGKLLVAALSRSEIQPDLRRHFHLIVDEYHSFATDSFPTLQSEARKFAIDTTVAHQYRGQLDELNEGSTLNVGNFILFRTTGRDARELALQFDNAPPEAEPVSRAILRRTGRADVYRSGGERELVAGNRRSYSDVEAESANQLTNTPNYRAHCKLIEGGVLREFYIATRKVEGNPNPIVAQDIRERSRKLATPRSEVEARIASLWEEEGPRSYRAE